MSTLDDLKAAHPEWCFNCGYPSLEHHDEDDTCPFTADVIIAALLAKAREDEARIEGLNKALRWYKEVQVAWLVERNMTPEGQEYLFVDGPGIFGWTTDNQRALRLARKADAETLVAIVDDAVRVAEHAWG